MKKYRYSWLIGCIAILLLASGCFQAAGTGPEGLSVADNTNPTWTPSPFPTVEPLVVTQEIVVTATPDFFAQDAPTDEFGIGGAIAQEPTFDPFTDQIDPLAAPTFDPFAEQQQIDPIYITATFIVQRATETEAYNMTQTAGAPFATLTPTFAPDFPTATPTFSGGACVHTVVVGDNLFRIAMRYNTTIDAIAAANGIANINVIVVGQQLNIPNCGGGTVPPPGTGGCTTTYTVQQGDTLWRISMTYNVPVMSIAAANPQITNINLIFINQQICIPPA